MQNSTNLSLSTSHVPSSSSSSSNSSSSSLPSSHHTGTVGLTNDALNSIVDRLTQGILPNEVKFRPIPGGRQCAYLPADDIIGVANETFGFHRWSCEIKNLNLIHATRDNEGRWTVAYSCTMKVSFGTSPSNPLCYHEDVGYGTAERQSKADAAFEQAIKSAITDARKRCLRLFGPSLGQNVNSEEFQKQAQTARQVQQKQQQQQQHSNSGSNSSSSSSSSGTVYRPPSTGIPSVAPIVPTSSVLPPPLLGITHPSSTTTTGTTSTTAYVNVLPPQPSSAIITASVHPPSTAGTIIQSTPPPPKSLMMNPSVDAGMVVTTSPPSVLLPSSSSSMVSSAVSLVSLPKGTMGGPTSVSNSVPGPSIPVAGQVSDDKQLEEREYRKRRAELQREEFLAKRMAISSNGTDSTTTTTITSVSTTTALNTSNPLLSVSSLNTLPDTMMNISSSPPVHTPYTNNTSLAQSFIPPSTATAVPSTITLNNNKANTYNFDIPLVPGASTSVMNTSQNIPPSVFVSVPPPSSSSVGGIPMMGTFPPIHSKPVSIITSAPPMNK